MMWQRKLIRAALVLVVLVAIGFAYQRLMENRDAHAHPPPGERIDIGGYKLHLHCMGQGSPTVVLDAGLGGFSMDWVRVKAPLARFTRTCSFDRAGYGWSDDGPGQRDIAQNAQELELLLGNAGESAPYLLVGHSLGGANAWRFAQERPELVEGVVLVDAPDQAELSREADGALERERTQRIFYRSLHGLASIGMLRVLAAAIGDGIAPDTIHYLPERERPAYRSVMLRSAFYRAGLGELRELRGGAAQLAGAGALGDTPVIVITATESGIENWLERQEELLALSTRTEHRLAAGSSHFVQLDQPEVIIQAVRDLIDAATDGR